MFDIAAKASCWAWVRKKHLSWACSFNQEYHPVREATKVGKEGAASFTALGDFWEWSRDVVRILLSKMEQAEHRAVS